MSIYRLDRAVSYWNRRELVFAIWASLPIT